MSGGWKFRACCLVGSIVLAIYLLLPTALGLADKREAWHAAGQAAPWYDALLPEHGLKLGLDLQGGIYVELEVDLNSALRRKTDILGNELLRLLEDRKVTGVNFEQTSQGHLVMTFPNAAALAELEKIRTKYSYHDQFTLQEVGAANPSPATAADQDKPNAGVVRAELTLTKPYVDRLKTSVVAQATESVRNRINRYGVGEPDIRAQGENRIAIELPGLKDPDRALDLIKRTGQLELRMVHEVSGGRALDEQQSKISLQIAEARKTANLTDDDFSAAAVTKLNDALKGKLPEHTEIVFELKRSSGVKKVIGGIPFLVEDKAQVTGDMLENSKVTVDDEGPKVAFTLNKTGAKVFGELTKANVGHYLAIILDGTVMSAPVIKSPILGGSGVIELGQGDFQARNREAYDLALVLQEGALPATLTEATKNVVGPSLGADLIHQGMLATALAAFSVIFFMILYYRLSGVLADFAVILNVVLVLAVLTLFDATLTLPGIAGIVLTIGMAVDANVLINERIREELRAGKPARLAVQLGYEHAKRAIIDSNVTTLIAGIFLYEFGTGPIKGFAVTLCVGIATTLFTAVVVTETIYEYLFARRRIEQLSI